jgi:hypothetical protein
MNKGPRETALDFVVLLRRYGYPGPLVMVATRAGAPHEDPGLEGDGHKPFAEEGRRAPGRFYLTPLLTPP